MKKILVSLFFFSSLICTKFQLLPEKIKQFCNQHLENEQVKNLKDHLESGKLEQHLFRSILGKLISTMNSTNEFKIEENQDELIETTWNQIMRQPISRQMLLHRPRSLSERAPARVVNNSSQVPFVSQADVLSSLVNSQVPVINFRNVVGDIPEEILDLKKILEKDPFYVQVGVKKPFGILFYGPTGTGKSLLARALAGELRSPFLYRAASSFINKFVGVGASAIRDLFQEAQSLTEKNDLVIVFIDELDAAGQSRETDSNSESVRTITQLMTLMDGSDESTVNKQKIIVIGATNRIDALDSALIRRFDHKIEIPLPDKKKRFMLINYYLKLVPRRLDEELDIDSLSNATDNFNCADIENLVNQVALCAARQKRGIINQDFKCALASIKKI